MRDKPGNHTDAWRDDDATVSRAYRELKQPEPPVHLDEKILAEARRAVSGPDKVVIQVQRWRQWAMPAALAATVVFAVPLVVRVLTSEQLLQEASRTTATQESEQRTLDVDRARAGKGAMQPELLESGTDLAELTSPDNTAARQTEDRLSVVKPQAPPGPAFASERADLFPPGANRQTARTGLPEAVMDEPAPAVSELASSTDMAEESGRYSGERKPVERRQTARLADDRTDYSAGRFAAADNDVAKQAGTNRSLSGNSLLEPETWLSDIADQHRRGQVRQARRELGYFLQAYPNFELPDDFPLRARDALFDDKPVDDPAAAMSSAGASTGDIVPEAASWLRGIGRMAGRGQIDQARTQLAEFFAIYPDYPLPADFPLTREDALPIEQ